MRLIAFLMLSCSLFAQSTRLELKLGRLTVYLGESKADVLRDMKAVHYTTTEQPLPIEDMTVTGVGEKPCYNNLKDTESCRTAGNIQFQGGKLSYAWREWSSDKPIVDVMNALDAVTKESNICTIKPPPKPIFIDHPDPPGRRISREIYIECGGRTVELWDLKELSYLDPSEWIESTFVFEWIGNAGITIEIPDKKANH